MKSLGRMLSLAVVAVSLVVVATGCIPKASSPQNLVELVALDSSQLVALE